jgi:hypothetical protein
VLHIMHASQPGDAREHAPAALAATAWHIARAVPPKSELVAVDVLMHWAHSGHTAVTVQRSDVCAVLCGAEPGSWLEDFYARTQPMSPADRGAYLERPPSDAPSLDDAHEVSWSELARSGNRESGRVSPTSIRRAARPPVHCPGMAVLMPEPSDLRIQGAHVRRMSRVCQARGGSDNRRSS